MYNLNKIIIVLVMFSLISCGEDDVMPVTLDLGESVGVIKAIVTGSKSFNPNISHGQITQYQVMVSGEGFETIEAVFDGNAQGGTIEGVPCGADRTVRVEAINPNNAKIRMGETAVDVQPSVVTEAVIKMKSVPIFANLADGNIIPNTQLLVKVFADPSEAVMVDDEFDGVALPLFDISTAQTEITPDISTGIARLSPPLLPEGEHTLTVKNPVTGYSTSISIRLTDGTKLKPAPTVGAVSDQPAEILGGAL